MARRGVRITNPVTGETVTFLDTAADTSGSLLRLEMTAERCSIPRHLHPTLAEHWQLEQGRVRYRVGDQEGTLEAPGRLSIPAGVPHSFQSDGAIRTIAENAPAGRFEDFLETVYALARAGKTNKKGRPNLLRAAVIARAHLDDYALPFPPLALQRLLFGLLAPLGRLLGYRARYP